MYRLLLYVLLVLAGVAEVLSFLKILPFDPIGLAISAGWLVFVCYVANKVFSYVFEAPTNLESVYITALILFLIISPTMRNFNDLAFMGWAGTLAIASKYILAINKKHIFNPAAIAVALTAFAIGSSASWWVGTSSMFPFVLIGGLLIVKKIQRFDLFFSFLATSVIGTLLIVLQSGGNFITTLQTLFISSSLLFFGFIMLTEPLTTPPTRKLRMIYGALVGIIFIPNLHFGSIYSTPEIALVIGNIFAYLVSPKQKLVMSLANKVQIAPDIMDFAFALPNAGFKFTPGQYMEWTLPHKSPDSRGNRRYFTIASSPTENNLLLGVKFYENGSSFKRNLKDLSPSGKIVGSQLAGEFLLPKDPNKKYVFMAGGIGITPFRSMLKYLIDTNTKMNILVIFSNKIAADIVYKDVLDQASANLGIKTYYTLTDEENIPADWNGGRGRIDAKTISRIPYYKEAYYYLSGPHVMVKGFEQALSELGIPKTQIRKDFFPGFV